MRATIVYGSNYSDRGGHVTGSWKDVLNDTSTLERYKSVFHERNEELGAFIETRIEQPPREGAATDTGEAGGIPRKRPLESIPVAVKDNIAVEGFRLTCGSKLLEHYTCPYDATAVAGLREAGAFVPGKTALDEFGMGSATDTSSFVDCRNPWDRARTAGGSSGGSAVAVAAGMVPAALGSDTGGSIRQPAGFCGVYGLKPTYGAVSRYGLVAYASSLDTVGVLADNPQRLADVFFAVRGSDERDQTSARAAAAGEADRGGSEVQGAGGGAHGGSGGAGILETLESMEGLRIGVLEGDLGLAPGVEKVYRGTIERLARHGCEIVNINLKSLEYAAAVYHTIAAAEASANLARFDGVRYGARPDYAENPEEMTRLARSYGLGDEVKLRILLGTFVLRSGFHDQYYGRAQRLRSHISRELRETFEACSAILAPTFPTVAFPLGSGGPDGLARKQADRFTSLANLAGLPALAFPAGTAHPEEAGAGNRGDAPGGGEAGGDDQVRAGARDVPGGEAGRRGQAPAAGAGNREQPGGGQGSSAGALPVGLQLLGPAWSEERLLSIAAALHAEQQPATPPDYPRVWS